MVTPTIVYKVILDGVTIHETTDFSLGVDMCLAWRRNNPRLRPSRIRLV